MSRTGRGRDQPRAMIHRRILDVAAANPEASLASLADEVSGASVSLVERVLDEYGDPSRESASDDVTDQSMEQTNVSDDETETTADSASSSTDDTESETPPETESHHSADTEADSASSAATATETVPDEGTLSEKQRRTLRAVYERPDASQGDLADELDVTRATVSRRLNAIPGFEWPDRQAFADSVFEGEASLTTAAESDGGDSEASEPNETQESDSSTQPGEDSRERPDAENGSRPTADEQPASVDGGDRVLSALGDVRASLTALDERVTTLEARESSAPTETNDSLSPELAHRVVHACMESDRITEDEELEVLRTCMQQ